MSLDNDFGHACDVCDRLWFRNDLQRLDEPLMVSVLQILLQSHTIHALIREVNRNQNRQRPRGPRDLADIEIVELYEKTLDGEKFFTVDTGRNGLNGISEPLCSESLYIC